MRAVFEGVFSAILTPMDADERVDEAELRNQVDRMVEAGLHGIAALGTNGEFYALDMDEKTRVLEVVVEQTGGRVPVIAGTGCITTKETVCLSKSAKAIGVDGLFVVAPYYASVSQDELGDHYKTVATTVALPLIAYNIPSRTVNRLEPGTVGRLSEVDNVVGVKDTSGDFSNTLAYIEEGGPDLAVYAGNDSLILWTLMAGGAGAVSGLSNVIPEAIVRIYELWRQGDVEGAKLAQRSIIPLRNCLKLANPNSVTKRAANLIGQRVGPSRRPAVACSLSIDRKLTGVIEMMRRSGLLVP